MLFNIFFNDLLDIIESSNICNFADDNTIYDCGNTVRDVTSRLENDLSKVLAWFSTNQLVANPAKFQMMFLGCPNADIKIDIDDVSLLPSDFVKLLDITLDSKLSFKSHNANLCKRASGGVRCLNRIRNYLSYDQAKLLSNSFILSTFSYAPIVWMSCTKSSCKAIESVHKRGLRAICNDFSCSLDELLQNTNSRSIHEQHLQHMLCEIYKTLKGINPCKSVSIRLLRTIKLIEIAG